MGWRTGGRWLAHCLRNKVLLLVALHFLQTHTRTHAHMHTPPPLACPPTISPSHPFSSPPLYAPNSGCANPPTKSGTQLPIWPSTTPAGRKEGWRGEWMKNGVKNGKMDKGLYCNKCSSVREETWGRRFLFKLQFYIVKQGMSYNEI